MMHKEKPYVLSAPKSYVAWEDWLHILTGNCLAAPFKRPG
jgi:hypothetical protein